MATLQTLVNDPLSVVDAQFYNVVKDGWDDFSQLPERIIKQVTEEFQQRFSDAAALETIPHIMHSGIEKDDAHGKLFRARVMVQHDALGDQFFIPICKSHDNTVHNVDLFFSRSHLLNSNGDLIGNSSQESMSFANLLGRKMVIGTHPSSSSSNVVSSSKLLIKFYDNQPTLVNQLIDVIGIFEKSTFTASAEDSEPVEYPHLLDCMHVVMTLPFKHHISLSMKSDSGRDRFLSLFSSFGEQSSLQILLAMMSSVSGRVNGMLSSLMIGYYPLNIRVPVGDEGGLLIELIAAVSDHCQVLRLDSATLENCSWSSCMNYETGVLEQGLLQLAQRSLLVIDERCLEPGKLSEIAARNLQHLFDLINHQTLAFDFGGHPVNIPMDVRIISISGGKSILPIDNYAEASQDGIGALQMADDGELQQIRSYLCQCMDTLVQVPAEVAKEIESGLENGDICLEANALAMALNIARLLSRTHLCEFMTMNHVHEAVGICKRIKNVA